MAINTRTFMTFEVFPDKKGKSRFRMKAGNNKVVIQSEGYASMRNALKTIARIITDIQNGKVKVRAEVK